jgi:excinuclease ABC subunit A
MAKPKFIEIKNARVNNLQNISLKIPRDKFVVISGVSGSGKTSLAFDTIFAEGQRKYIESLSSYARQFLKKMDKPNVDSIKGLSPAIAVDQKRNNKNPRSTVGTLSEVYDYLKLLYTTIGKTYSPISGKVVKKENQFNVYEYFKRFKRGSKYYISINKTTDNKNKQRDLEILLQKGFTRAIVDGEFYTIESLINLTKSYKTYSVLFDRGIIDSLDENFKFKIIDISKEAFYEGEGYLTLNIEGKEKQFSNKFELDGMLFVEPTLNLFSFNNPYGACTMCGGFGNILGIDKNKVIPNKNLSILSDCVAPWRSEKMSRWLKPLLLNNKNIGISIHKSYVDLSAEEKKILWEGEGLFKGINKFFSYLERKSYKIQYRIISSRYKGKTKCENCLGSGIRTEAHYVKINNKSILDLVVSPINKVLNFIENVHLSNKDRIISNRIIDEITTRLSYINSIGLGYLTLNRKVSTLSGGEFQRIKLATSLGSSLVGSLYVLDEPTVGLHPFNTNQLIILLNSLKEQGNTVLVVEHDEDVIKSSDFLIDIGPGAGSNGGEIMYLGKTNQISKSTLGPTADYIFNKKKKFISKPRLSTKSLKIINAHENNLKNLNVEIPLECLVVITGVSGSGKSTLIKTILYPALAKRLEINYLKEGKYDNIEGDIDILEGIQLVDQNPIGRSSRSNPATYIKAYDAIRKIFADEATHIDYTIKSSDFSFNVDGGRCEECLGDGFKKVEMQFMADIFLECDSCKGKRFKKKILDIKYNNKNIFEVLNLTIEESLSFFNNNNSVIKKLKPLNDVGLGYLKLGQPSSTLSGGEAQRLKLASCLADENKKSFQKTLFIFDEPTSGLHYSDIANFMKSIQKLINIGNSVIIIEHNTDLIKQADWLIDLGPEGGEGGGRICFSGYPKDIITKKGNKTGKYLKKMFV